MIRKPKRRLLREGVVPGMGGTASGRAAHAAGMPLPEAPAKRPMNPKLALRQTGSASRLQMINTRLASAGQKAGLKDLWGEAEAIYAEIRAGVDVSTRLDALEAEAKKRLGSGPR